MERITEQLSQLQELSNEELAELEETVLNEFSTTEQQELTSQSVSQLSQLADAVEAVRTEQARRATEAQALQEAAAEAALRVKGAEAAVENPEEAAAEETVEETAPEAEAATATTVPPVPSPKESHDTDDPAVPSGNPSDPAEDPADSLENPGNDSEEEKKKKLPGVPTTAQFSEESEATTEAAVEQPEGSEASVEEPVEGSEASAEVPAEAEASVEGEVAAEAAVETPAEAEASVEETSETNTEATVTASASGGSEGLEMEVPAGHEPVVKPTTTMTITAGADIPNISAGAKLEDTLAVADAFQKRLHTLRHVHGGDGEQHIVASFQQEFPEDRYLVPNDAMANTDRIQAVTDQGLVAAAGICLPLETRYDMGCDVGVTDRPVRDALVRFGADRGGIRFFSAPTLASTSPNFANATGFWRGNGDAQDGAGSTFHTYGPDRTTATSPADAKPCLEMNCVAEETAYIEAITLCLTFNNLTTRTFPELIKRQNELALVAHARVAENALLAQIEAGSTQVTAQAQVVGATREILNLFDRAVAAYRFKHRMASSSPLRAILPTWVRNLLRADIALQMPGDGFDVFNLADSQIDAWFRSRNINAAWHLDGDGPAAVDADGAGSGTALAFELPDTIEFALFAEGAWLFLDGGTLDLGVIRDSSLVATNQYKQFVESFEGLANIGCDSYWVTAEYRPSGQAASLVDTLV